MPDEIDSITIVASVQVKIDIPMSTPLGEASADNFLTRAALVTDGVIEDALRATYPEKRPGWYQWASHSCGKPVSRCVSIEAVTLMVKREDIERAYED